MKECLAKLKTKSRNSTIQKCVTDECVVLELELILRKILHWEINVVTCTFIKSEMKMKCWTKFQQNMLLNRQL